MDDVGLSRICQTALRSLHHERSFWALHLEPHAAPAAPATSASSSVLGLFFLLPEADFGRRVDIFFESS